MPGDPLVSVVIVNWNGRDWLEGCLNSVRNQTLRDLEVLVIDNGSTDGSRDDLEAAASRGELVLIRNSRNLGFCAANNQGIAVARGPFIALLNNDAEAHPKWLEELAEAVERDRKCGMAASKILRFDDHSRIDKAGHLIYPDGQNRGRGSGEIDRGQYDDAPDTAWPDGCAALYRKSMLDEIGGFDEDFFAYADDAELGLRARLAGWKAAYAPGAIAYHRVGSSLGRYSKKRLFLIERNRLWLVIKLFPWRLWPAVPVFFAMRLAATAIAARRGEGEAGSARSEIGLLGLLQCLVSANIAALWGLPKMLRKRRVLRKSRRLTGAEAAALLRRYRISLAQLVSRAA